METRQGDVLPLGMPVREARRAEVEEEGTFGEEVPGCLSGVLAQSARDISGVMHIGQVILEKVVASCKLDNQAEFHSVEPKEILSEGSTGFREQKFRLTTGNFP